mmetsp:Transcript_20059/g.43172  ORF Transcript_20059/g.43172 Transcript_20059/m.43172 type:complete len:206 (-) Transcript_20059:183-800(-)
MQTVRVTPFDFRKGTKALHIVHQLWVVLFETILWHVINVSLGKATQEWHGVAIGNGRVFRRSQPSIVVSLQQGLQMPKELGHFVLEPRLTNLFGQGLALVSLSKTFGVTERFGTHAHVQTGSPAVFNIRNNSQRFFNVVQGVVGVQGFGVFFGQIAQHCPRLSLHVTTLVAPNGYLSIRRLRFESGPIRKGNAIVQIIHARQGQD